MLENDNGEITAEAINLYDALIRNIDGQITADASLDIYNGNHVVIFIGDEYAFTIVA